MKKILIALFTAVSLWSCEEDTKLNTHAMTAKVNYAKHWKSQQQEAVISDKDLLVYGTDGKDTLIISVENYQFDKKFVIGQDRVAIRYIKVGKDTVVYNAAGNIGSGNVSLKAYENNDMVSGTFSASLKRDDNDEYMNLSEGVFYQVKIKK